jgi:hypothetical protein
VAGLGVTVTVTVQQQDQELEAGIGALTLVHTQQEEYSYLAVHQHGLKIQNNKTAKQHYSHHPLYCLRTLLPLLSVADHTENRQLTRLLCSL